MSNAEELDADMRMLLRAAALAVLNYTDSKQYDRTRDKAHIAAIVKAASELNAIVQLAKEIT